MIALFSFLIVILLSLFVVRIGAIALEATGISSDVAVFESLSAFSGVGFSTNESELIMGSAIRRKIIRVLIVLGSAGLTTGVATLIVTLLTSKGDATLFNYEISPYLYDIIIIVLSSLLLYLVSKTKTFDLLLRWLFHKMFKKIKRRVSMYDYESLLGMSKGFGVIQFVVPKRNWMVSKTIGELKLEKEGVNVLGVFRTIHRHEEYIGLPSNDFKIHSGDKIVIYCRESVVENLAKREKGKEGYLLRKKAEIEQKKVNLINQLDEEKLKLVPHHEK